MEPLPSRNVVIGTFTAGGALAVDVRAKIVPDGKLQPAIDTFLDRISLGDPYCPSCSRPLDRWNASWLADGAQIGYQCPNCGARREGSYSALLKDVCGDIRRNYGEYWQRYQNEVGLLPMKVTREGIFFAGQYFDALRQVTGILDQAQRSIVIIDGYVDGKILSLLTSKKSGVAVRILTFSVTPALKTSAAAFNKQYGNLSVRTSTAFHDRFLIIDDRDFYHFGASLKDAGTRGFMFSLIEEPEVMHALRTKCDQEWSTATVEV